MGQMDGHRRVAAGAAQNQLASEHYAGDGIIRVAHNGTVVDKEQISNAAQPFHGFAFIRANRFVGKVAAGGDQRKTARAQKKMMQRRCRVGVK